MQTVNPYIPNPVVSMSPDPLNTVFRPEPVPAAELLPEAPPTLNILPLAIPDLSAITQEPSNTDVTVHMEGPTVNITLPDYPPMPA